MRKLIQIDDTFPTGEPSVSVLVHSGRNGRILREDTTKIASDASDYVQSVTPQAGKSIVLVIALGAYDRWGLNKNFDGFPDQPYRVGQPARCGHAGCQTSEGWVSEPETIRHHYKSFEDGRVFTHHQNKDPDKSVGDVIKAFWNPRMFRVELLLGVDNQKAPEFVDRIDSGESVAVSMGCRIRFDTCTICGHRAPTRKDYCDHLKFTGRQIHSSGVQCGALNGSPKFFDISFVIRPADPTGYMMRKVADDGAYNIQSSAELGEYHDLVDEKRAAIQKLSDIDKVVRGLPIDYKISPLTPDDVRQVQNFQSVTQPAVRRLPELDPTTLKNMSAHPVANVLSTLASAGIILTTPEFVQLLMHRLAPGVEVPNTALDTIVAMQGQIFDLFAQHPQMLDQVMQSGNFDMNKSNVSPVIHGIAEKYLEKRSTMSNYLSRALVPAAIRDEEPPMTDVLNVRDPSTGDLYQTNRGAAINAHDNIAKGQLAKMLGGTALLAGAYKLLTHGQPKLLQPVAAASLGYLGAKHLKPDFGPQYMTEEGVPVPSLTELHHVKNASALKAGLPLLGTAAIIAALSHDYESRLNKGHPVHDPGASVQRRLADQLGASSSEHPALTGLGMLSAYGLGKHVLSKISSDETLLPDVDLDFLAQRLGEVILP